MNIDDDNRDRAVNGRAKEQMAEERAARVVMYDLVQHIKRQAIFSALAFGPGSRSLGVVAHIRKELEEIEADPSDLYEWIDVVLLALDGAWRSGHSPEEIATALHDKLSRNEKRTWPDWRTAPKDAPIEHVRSGEVMP